MIEIAYLLQTKIGLQLTIVLIDARINELQCRNADRNKTVYTVQDLLKGRRAPKDI